MKAGRLLVVVLKAELEIECGVRDDADTFALVELDNHKC